MGKFVIKSSKAGFRFSLKAGNGETIAVSEVYSSEQSCRGGIESVKKNAPLASVEDQTKAGYAEEKHPKFEIFLDKDDAFRFRLKAKNGEIIAASEAYKAKASCIGGIESVKSNAPKADIVAE